MTMWTRLTSVDGLVSAWRDVLASAGTHDEVPGGFKHFERHADERIAHLNAALAGGWYRPRELRVHRIPKEDGSRRILHVPPLDDRVVERAVLNELQPLIDPVLTEAAHAYRPGRGVHSAVRAVARLRDEGFTTIARADVDDCFPSIDRARVREALDRIPMEAQVRDLLDRFLVRRAAARRPEDHLTGLPQGSPLSPLLMNLVLTPFDEALLAAGIPMVRYADDLVLAARHAADAESALARARHELERWGLRVGEDKMQITDFESGFSFLGEDFGPRLPVSDEGEADPDAPRSIFVGLQGARVSAVRGRLLVATPDDVERLDVPLGKVGRLVLAGSVSLSAGARSWALLNDVRTVFLSRTGSLLGTLEAPASPGRRLRLSAQLAFLAEEGRTVDLARTMVRGKIRKQRVILQRLARRGDAAVAASALAVMSGAVDAVTDAPTLDAVMGHEGVAARAYFGAMGQLVPAGLGFAGRSRRPPRDVVNAALSYGYAILLGEAVSALHVYGLDPAFGILHRDQVDRESLALDLVEEFRPWVVDAAVMAMIRRGTLTPERAHIEPGRDGVWIDVAAKSALVAAYETRMLASAKGALSGFAGSVRRCLYAQAHRLALHIQDAGTHPYRDCSWR